MKLPPPPKRKKRVLRNKSKESLKFSANNIAHKMQKQRRTAFISSSPEAVKKLCGCEGKLSSRGARGGKARLEYDILSQKISVNRSFLRF